VTPTLKGRGYIGGARLKGLHVGFFDGLMSFDKLRMSGRERLRMSDKKAKLTACLDWSRIITR